MSGISTAVSNQPNPPAQSGSSSPPLEHTPLSERRGMGGSRFSLQLNSINPLNYNYTIVGEGTSESEEEEEDSKVTFIQ